MPILSCPGLADDPWMALPAAHSGRFGLQMWVWK